MSHLFLKVKVQPGRLKKMGIRGKGWSAGIPCYRVTQSSLLAFLLPANLAKQTQEMEFESEQVICVY